ncbi:hypothetical protein Cgig2_007962 [Carnegiea gigantea]|uniref:Rx N-terminal domain-containing protein n=1 Tax=Carnegiea gigantea TaxID=171969 RepID=A0A9Q1QHM5_9CARY|nr:hypothetical protein Cgig2_007962 [Carnegiea gigantea]
MALEAIIGPLVKSVFPVAMNEFLFVARTESYTKDLAETKALIQALLLDADKRTQEDGTSSNVRRFELEKLSAALDGIDDLLDEKASQSKIIELAGFKDRVCLFFSLDMNPVLSSCSYARQIKDIRQKLDFAKDNSTLCNVIGRDLARNYLIKRLLDPSSFVIATAGLVALEKPH